MEPGTPGGSASLWMCGTRGRPCQAFWECRVLVETSRINLVLGEIFYQGKVGALELRALQDGVLELRALQAGALELRAHQVGALELCPGKEGALELRALQVGVLELRERQDGVLELRE